MVMTAEVKEGHPNRLMSYNKHSATTDFANARRVPMKMAQRRHQFRQKTGVPGMAVLSPENAKAQCLAQHSLKLEIYEQLRNIS